MTQKDYVKAKLEILKFVVIALLAFLFLVIVYYLQHSGLVPSLVSLFLFIIIFYGLVNLTIEHEKLMNELRELP